MKISTLWQLNLFSLSILSGAVFALIWDWCNILRRGKISTFFADVLLFTAFGGWNFLFILYWIDGRVRFFVFFSECFGFTLYMLLLHPITKWAQKYLKKIILPVYSAVKIILHYMLLPIKKCGNICKKALKSIGKRGYNLSVSMCSRTGKALKWKRKEQKEEE